MPALLISFSALFPFAQHNFKFSRWNRFAEVKPLEFIAVILEQKVAVLFGFHTFGNYLKFKAVSQRNYRPHYGGVLRSVSISRTKDWSIFSVSTGKRFK